MTGQDGRADRGWVAAVASLLALVLLAAVGVAALRTDPASADTVLARGSDARVVLADGTATTVEVGDRVPVGATVSAGRTGAVLSTRDREVHLGGATEVTVVDGVRQVLRRGFVLVDASGGAPGLQLETAAATVTTPDDGLVRVDGGPLVRVGVLRGAAAAVRAAQRRATSEVPTYFQVQVAPGALPGTTSPFVLTPGDAYERDLAADLVRADEDLTALASRLDADGRAGRVVMAALREGLPAGPVVPAGAPDSEGTLGYLIAAASPGPSLADRYAEVRDLRDRGGSWGVVAAIVDAGVGRVGAALESLLDPGTVPVLAGGALDPGTLLLPGGDGSAQAPQDDTPGEPQRPAASSGPRPTPSPGPGSASPTPQPGPLTPVTDVVDTVVDTVLDLISPSPRPPAPLLVVPTPLPAAAPLGR